MQITVKLERDDYIHGYLWAYYLGIESRPMVVGLALMIVLMFLGLSLLRRVSPARLSLPLLIGPLLSAAVGACLPLYTYWRARTIFRQRWWLHQPTRYTLDSRGIASQAPSYSGFREWNRIWRVEENGRSFLIYLSRAQVVVVPKRFFVSEDQIRAFRELAAHNCARVSLLHT